MKPVNFYVAHETPEYCFEVEEFRDDDERQMIFVHLRVDDWSRKVLAELLRVWKAFRECVTVPVYCAGEVDDDKFEGFARIFGFVPLTEGNECTDGQRRRIFIHVKDLNNVGLSEADDASAA